MDRPRRSTSSTAHDGFTLADLTAYDHKHNEGNGEDNRDGSTADGSWNHGAEGPTDDPTVLAARRRTVRNLLGSLLLSTGVPMLTAGDEVGRTQRGNNNAYCQDNATTWVDWDLQPWQQDLLATTRHLLSLRRHLPVLRRRVWSVGRQVHDDGPATSSGIRGRLPRGQSVGRPGPAGGADGPRGVPPTDVGFDDGSEGATALVVVNGAGDDAEVTLPAVPGVTAYRLLWDSVWERPAQNGEDRAPGVVTVPATSLRIYSASHDR